MPTSNSSKSSSFFTSRKNIVGMTLAILVIIIHLVAGLGILWPVVAVAGYGAGALLTPRRQAEELPAQLQAPPRHAAPQELRKVMGRQAGKLSDNKVPWIVHEAVIQLDDALNMVLDHWEHLVDFPEYQVTVRSMILDYIPSLVDTYLKIPDFKNPRAVEDMVQSLKLLQAEADSIYQVITEIGLNNLEDHNRILHMQFGKLPLDENPESAGKAGEKGSGAL